MVTPELVDYIRSSLKTNVPEEQIAETLRSSGWEETDIKAGFVTVKSASATQTPDVKPVSPASFRISSVERANNTQAGPAMADTNLLKKKQSPLLFIIAFLVIVLLGGGLALAYSKTVWPFGGSADAQGLFDNVVVRALEIQSASYALTLSFESEPLAQGAEPFHIPLSGEENTEDSRFAETLNGIGENLNFLPAEFRVAGTISGTAEKAAGGGDSHFEISGEAKLGDSSYNVGLEFLKKGDLTYARINKFPGEFGFFMNISALKGKWVKIDQADITSRSHFGLRGLDTQEELKKSTEKALNLLRQGFKIAREENYISYEGNPAREKIGNIDTLRYRLRLDPEKTTVVLDRLVDELKKEYGDQPEIASAIEESAKKTGEFLKSGYFKDFLAYLNKTGVYELWIDRKTGFPVKVSSAVRLVPSDTPLSKTKNVQYTLRVAQELKNINTPITIEEPQESIPFEDAMKLLGFENVLGLTAEARDVQRISDLATLRSAISLYLADVPNPQLCAGSKILYSSAEITVPTGWQKGASMSVTNTNGTGWLPINFNKISSGSPLSELPRDPTNNGTKGLVYIYACDPETKTFELNARLESNNYNRGGKSDVVSEDGGDNPKVYEVGTNLQIVTPDFPAQ